jgi:hypothetical protein
MIIIPSVMPNAKIFNQHFSLNSTTTAVELLARFISQYSCPIMFVRWSKLENSNYISISIENYDQTFYFWQQLTQNRKKEVSDIILQLYVMHELFCILA